MLRWALLLALLSTSALASRADRLSVSPRLDRRDRLGATAAAPDPILLSLSLLPPDSECSGTPPDGVTFTRASAATCIRSNGTAVALASNQARVHSTLGLLVEGSATNAALHSRDVTAASWTGTGCAKTATGMDGAALVGRCTGPTTTTQTLSVATGARTASVYVRRVSGTCNVSLEADLETTSKALIGGWERLTLTYTSDGSVGLGVSINSGCVADIDYVQDEAGSVATSPIVTGGTAAVRAAEIATATLPSGISETRGCGYITFAPLWTGNWPDSGDSRILGMGTNHNRLGYTASSYNAYAGSGNAVAGVQHSHAAGVPNRYGTEWNLTTGTYRVRNVTAGIDGSPASFVGFQQAFSVVQIGHTYTSSAAMGHLRNLVLGAAPEACQ